MRIVRYSLQPISSRRARDACSRTVRYSAAAPPRRQGTFIESVEYLLHGQEPGILHLLEGLENRLGLGGVGANGYQLGYNVLLASQILSALPGTSFRHL